MDLKYTVHTSMFLEKWLVSILHGCLTHVTDPEARQRKRYYFPEV